MKDCPASLCSGLQLKSFPLKPDTEVPKMSESIWACWTSHLGDTFSCHTLDLQQKTHEEITTAALMCCQHSYVQLQITESYVKCLSTATFSSSSISPTSDTCAWRWTQQIGVWKWKEWRPGSRSPWHPMPETGGPTLMMPTSTVVRSTLCGQTPKQHLELCKLR